MTQWLTERERELRLQTKTERLQVRTEAERRAMSASEVVREALDGWVRVEHGVAKAA